MQASTTTDDLEDTTGKYHKSIERMLQWLEWLEDLHKGTVKTEAIRTKFKTQFKNSTANMGWEPGFVTLARLCTSVERRDGNDKILGAQAPISDGQKIILGFDHLKVVYDVEKQAENKVKETISVTGAQLDYTSGEKPQEVEMALLERARMAFIAANIAVMEGWKHVSFDKVEDPVERYMLYAACKALKLNVVMPEFDKSTLPEHPLPGFNMQQECIKAMETTFHEPDAPIINPHAKEKEKPVVTPDTINKAASFFTQPKAA